MLIERHPRELAAAGFTLMMGLFGIIGGVEYNIGKPARMGPGFFPVMIGSLLILVSALMIATPMTQEEAARQPRFTPEWRAWGFVIGALLAFILLGRHFGLLPATFTLVFLAALGDSGNSLKTALILAVGISIVAVVLFSWLLQMQFPLFIWR